MTFHYDDAVLTRFPALRAGIIELSGAHNGPSPGALIEQFADEQALAALQLDGVALDL